MSSITVHIIRFAHTVLKRYEKLCYVNNLLNFVRFFSQSVQKTNANDVKSERDDCGGNKRAKRKAKTVKVTYEHRFFPANVSEYTLNPYKRSKLNEDGSLPIIPSELRLVFCTGEGTLPDHFMANLRILVGVWELELDDVQDEAIALLNLAVRDFMKNIITAMLTFKSSFRSYDNGKFRYAFGVPPLNPYLKNASSLVKYPQYSHSTFTDESGEHCAVIPPTTEFAEHEAMTQIACSFNSWNQLKSGNGKREEEDENKITLWHLFHALRIHKSVIPSHSVYAVNMERIITRLWHEDSECGNEFS
ncbi:transcriptional adapter 1-like protein [Dinothrombium tinctorium]|uniref:Transcriptional adapter 1-like protein n=1 Tax=Dinothrombium tinctorium TaxID=1965070 RepID=A0A3S3PY61_9ACAR|nr:transcriptional adapter 1-like protein [Dinothrombium tinctorium]RWS10588.1 transcriptional adapter 1-like protein [Dinothrombium tinctorium]